jgi:hypothetical protein
MPCYSRITVKVDDLDRLRDALRALGYDITVRGNVTTGPDQIIGEKNGSQIIFTRGTVTGDTTDLGAIMRQYAEIGIRQFALRKGYTVTKSERRLTLTGRG